MFVDLGFADIGIEPNRIEIRGKRGGTVREGDAVKEVPPASGAVGIRRLEDFVEALGTVIFEAIPKPAGSGDAGGGEAEPPAPAVGQEAAGSGEAATEEKENGEGATAAREEPGRDERRVPRYRGDDGFSLLIAPSRNRVWISAARNRDGKIIERTAGALRIARALVLADIAGKQLLQGRVVKSFPGVAFFATRGEVSFMEGSTGTTLQPYQRLELGHILTGLFLGMRTPFAYRAGRITLRFDGEKASLSFGRNRVEISPGDLMLIRVCCLA